jgi:hypothetical protein
LLALKSQGGNTLKKLIVVAVVVVMMMALSGNAFAANSIAQGSKGISVGMGDSVFGHPNFPLGDAAATQNPVVDISGRFFVAKDVALTLGAGLQMNSSDAEGTYLSLSFGARKYLSTNDFAPFVGGQITYVTWDAKVNGVKTADATIFDLAAFVGAEYFFSKNFSVEGAIGIGIGQATDDQRNIDTTYIGTRTVGVHANFYF